MKIFNYSTLSLLFTTIMQAVSGYTCPNIAEINKKIHAKKPMSFPLAKEEQPFWHYVGDNNRIKKFYLGTSEVTELGGMYFQDSSNEKKSKFMCIYKNNQSTYFSLAAGAKWLNKVNSSSITGSTYWRKLYANDIYACEGTNEPNKIINECQFSLNTR